MNRIRWFATCAAASLVSAALAEPVTFDFDDLVDNSDGTISGLSGFRAASGADGIAVSDALNGSPGLQATAGESDGFVILIENFTGTPAPGGTLAFNELLERGGTLTGRAIILNSGGPITSDAEGNPLAEPVDPETAGPQIFMARQGSTTGFDLTDGRKNYNFTGDQAVGTTFTFSFTLPKLEESNLDDAGGQYYGISLGISDAGPGAIVVFDEMVFTPRSHEH
ncbi:MAG: hypothetical protein AAF663_00500 [Planctomycetota bacterium]